MRSWCHGDRPEPVATREAGRDGIFADHNVHCGWLRSLRACAKGETVAPSPDAKPQALHRE